MDHDYLTAEQDGLLDQYIDSAVHSPSRRSAAPTADFLPPLPALPSLNSYYYVIDGSTTDQEPPAGPYSAASLHACAGSGQLTQDILVHEVRHEHSTTPSSLGWVSLGEAGLCDHRWYCRDETVSEDVQGPFTPTQVRQWFANGDLYWKYASLRTDRGITDEVDAWYFLDDEDQPQGPFPYFELRAWFCSGVLSNQRLIINEEGEDWYSAAEYGLGTSAWFLIDASDAVSGPLSALQVNRWFSTGWLEEWLYEAAGGLTEEEQRQQLQQQEEHDEHDEQEETPLWYYMDDDDQVQGPFTSSKMYNWFATGILTYLNRWVAYEQSEFVPSYDTALYVEEYDRWYLRDWPEEGDAEGEVYGPFSAMDLHDMLSEGLIGMGHEVALEGTQEWTWLSDHLMPLVDVNGDVESDEHVAEEKEEEEAAQHQEQEHEDQAYYYDSENDQEKSVWYYNDVDGSIVGPYTYSDLRELYVQGTLSPLDHWVCIEGEEEWHEPQDFGLVASSWDYGGWLVLARSSTEDDNQLHGPYLWSEVAAYCQEGLLGDDVLVSAGEHDWMTPEEAGMTSDVEYIEEMQDMLRQQQEQEQTEEDYASSDNGSDNANGSDNDNDFFNTSDVDSEDSVNSNSIEGISESRWYVQDNDSGGRSVGPYPFKDLVSWASTGLLKGSTYILSEAENATWQPFDEVVVEMTQSVEQYEKEEGDHKEEWAVWNEVDATTWMEEEEEEEEEYKGEETEEEEEEEEEEEDEEEEEEEEERDHDNEWYMLDDDDQVLGPFPQLHLIEWYENGAIHGEREVCCHGDDDWMRLKRMVFESKRTFVRGTGRSPSSLGVSGTDGLIGGGQRGSLEFGPMYASRVGK